MKGDFSRWDFDRTGSENFNGVVHQQGRVLLDSDWNARTHITTKWREHAGRDVVGPKVAAVPAAEPDGFKVTGAAYDSAAEQTTITLKPGRAWVDGMLTYLGNEAEITRNVQYLPTPPTGSTPTPMIPIAPDLAQRDAVILEIWQETLNGFQEPGQLMEPALGGPDTTERVKTSMAFRLLRMTGANDMCPEIPGLLESNNPPKGNLRVTLQPTIETGGDCPVAAGGGYTGFEHQLYRVEIAALNSGIPGPRFKWSRFNGGLVGRGVFEGADINIEDNYQPIATSGITTFYLEIVEYVESDGHHQVTYGAKVTLKENVLTVGDVLYQKEAGYTPQGEFFFRLWDDIRPLSEFAYYTAADAPEELEKGIRLEFETGKTYKPGDYWTFQVRAGEIGNPGLKAAVFSITNAATVTALETDLDALNSPVTAQIRNTFDTATYYITNTAVIKKEKTGHWHITDATLEVAYEVKKENGILNVYYRTLLVDREPQGIRYTRVPLAILTWSGAAAITDPLKIHDCRRVFHPLIHRMGCCTVTVGKKIGADFDNIQAAVNYLRTYPHGRICIFPGDYNENVIIDQRKNLTLSGCGEFSRIISKPPAADVTTANATIHIIKSENIRIESLAVEAHETGIGILMEGDPPETAAVETSPVDNTEAVQPPLLDYIKNITLYDLYIEATKLSAVKVLEGQYIYINQNRIHMKNIRGDVELSGNWPAVFFLGDDSEIQNNTIEVAKDIGTDDSGLETELKPTVPGGVQIAGTSDRVCVEGNKINGGTGNGITLGSIKLVDINGEDVETYVGGNGTRFEPCEPVNVYFPPGQDPTTGTIKVSAGGLSEIRITSNRILEMGLNGIGVVGYFNLEEADEFITVDRLTITGNEIKRCLKYPIVADMEKNMGYGGISLADAEYLVIDGNVIEECGGDSGNPTCGIYVLHGEGIDIFNNRIINNGSKDGSGTGPKGGIRIAYAVAPTDWITLAGKQAPRQDGVPAVRVQNNIVTTPVDRALSINALGPVSILGNQFTSRGVAGSSAFGSTVAILNLGLSNEVYLQILGFSFLNRIDERSMQFANNVPEVKEGVLFLPRPGLDDMLPGQYLSNGNVLFNDNQCVLDLLDENQDTSFSSIVILSLDDIAFQNNQCDCDCMLASPQDFVLSQAMIAGFSLRVSNNRFKEGLLFNALFSAVTAGIMNMTTYNQATHCLWILKLWGESKPNTVLWSRFANLIKISDNFDYCQYFGGDPGGK
ncbi:MAG: right-handed parallel beta-helix repeat-containing protein [bacterium]|nr:right-handed parallel beta-helix repeat-containing protein [bacterium]